MSRYYEPGPEDVKKLKADMLNAYVKLVGMGIYPSMKLIGMAMSLKAHRDVLSKIRLELVKSGEMVLSSRSNRMKRSYAPDPELVEKIRASVLDAYKQLVDDGQYPTLVLIASKIPYYVHNTTLSLVRKELIDEGLLIPVSRSYNYVNPTQKEIRELCKQIRIEKGESWD